MYKYILGIILFLLAALPASAASVTALRANTIVNGGDADSVFSAYWEFFNASRIEQGVVKLATIPPGTTDISIRLAGMCNGGYGNTYNVYSLSSPYNPDTLTWNNAPAVGHLIGNGIINDSGYHTISLNSQYISEINNGIKLVKTGGTGYCSGWPYQFFSEYVDPPKYLMNESVASAGSNLMGSMAGQIFGIIPKGVAIVGGAVTSLFGLRWLIGFVRGML